MVRAAMASSIRSDEVVALFGEAFSNPGPGRSLVEIAVHAEDDGIAPFTPLAEADVEASDTDKTFTHKAAYPAAAS